MRRSLSKFSDHEFDVVVLGGGIFGACAACDAAQRGMSVALIDRGDFCSATSANSFKLIHGGLRYLQHADLKRVRQSSAARRAFLRVAPHLAAPLPIVVPTYGNGMKGKLAMRAAMSVYDVVTPDRNRGIADPSRHVPRGVCLSKKEVLETYPGLPARGLTGAGIFCDGQMYNPPRLVLAFLESAAEAGAVVANYVEAVRCDVRQGQVAGVEVRDALTGDEFSIRSKCVLNATGPYAEPLLQQALGRSLSPPTQWSRDAYFVVNKPLINGRAALALPARTKDPEAKLSRGARHLFLTPWREHTLAGVWHKVHLGKPDDYEVTENELEEFLGEINDTYTGLDLTIEDISLWNAGLIPFGHNDPNAKDLKFGHRSRLVDHAAVHGIEGLVTLVGVRFTTGPQEATATIDLVAKKANKQPSRSRLHCQPIAGGAIESVSSLISEARQHPLIDHRTAAALVHNYGTNYRRVLAVANEVGGFDRLGTSPTLQAEVSHAVREEMAVTLSDVVLRRTDLGTGNYPGRAVLEHCAELMAEELLWNRERVATEIEQTMAAFPLAIRRRVDSQVHPSESASAFGSP